MYPISAVSKILLLAKSPVPNAISSPFSLYKVASAVNRFFDLNRTFPTASILPELTGFVMWILNEVVKTNASSTIELTAKKHASSSNLK